MGRKAKGLPSKTAGCLDIGLRLRQSTANQSEEVVMGRVFISKVALLFLVVLVLMLSLMAGTALSAILFKAVEL
jgi:hypothetical protein